MAGTFWYFRYFCYFHSLSPASGLLSPKLICTQCKLPSPCPPVRWLINAYLFSLLVPSFIHPFVLCLLSFCHFSLLLCFICLMHSLFYLLSSSLTISLPHRSSGHGPVLPFADNLAAMFTPGSLPQHYFEHLTYLLSSSFFDLNLNRERMSVYTSQANFALSRKNLAHLVQTIIFEEFAKFDYGEEDNQEIYGKLDPPEYDISAITNRTVALIYSSNDEWASVQDFESIGQRMRGKLHQWSIIYNFYLCLIIE